MKYTLFMFLAPHTIAACMVATLLALAATSARGDEYGRIVGEPTIDGQILGGPISEPIISEPLMSEPIIGSPIGEPLVGESIIGDEIAPPMGSYVGDMASCDAGVGCSDGSCGGHSCLGGKCGSGNCGGGTVTGRGYGYPDLFYNFYTQGYANQTNAQMYLSPLPVPPNVGHTFYTYQPFYPHHMLYWHKDRFHNYYDNGRGMNRTRAVYFSPPIRQAISNLYWNKLRLPR